jgi:hypothetical protein
MHTAGFMRKIRKPFAPTFNSGLLYVHRANAPHTSALEVIRIADARTSSLEQVDGNHWQQIETLKERATGAKWLLARPVAHTAAKGSAPATFAPNTPQLKATPMHNAELHD